jgi:hypothetical protein
MAGNFCNPFRFNGERVEKKKNNFICGSHPFQILADSFHISSSIVCRFFGSSSGTLADFFGNSRRIPEGYPMEYGRIIK